MANENCIANNKLINSSVKLSQGIHVWTLYQHLLFCLVFHCLLGDSNETVVVSIILV
jgi:hypothetical protein